MSDPNHTPGPWKYRPSYSNGEPQGYVVQSGIKVIADLCCSPEDLSVEEANARLIAAAPELLAALSNLLALAEDPAGSTLRLREVFGTWHQPPQIEGNMARAAIAKAKAGK